MMTECSSKNSVILCSENLSDNYNVELDEVLSYAQKLGINLDIDKYLLPIALKGLTHPLPSDWIPCYDTKQKEYFYFNKETNVSQWEHPIDRYFKDLITEIQNGNKGVESVSDYSDFQENLKMLPLRQKKKKPELIPIKQLLKFRDEDKSTFENEELKSDLQSALKSKNDSNFKKSVTFDTSEFKSSRLERNSLNFEDEFEKQIDEHDQASVNALWDSELRSRSFYDLPTENAFKTTKNNRVDHSAHNISSSGTNHFYSNPKSNNGSRSQNNFKRLHINLRHPDSNLFSDSNRDDTSKNVLSESMSSDTVTDEVETPENVLANVTESGIDVSTVTDLQKLKAKNLMNNQNNDMDKQILHHVNESVVNLERNLNAKLETKLANEITKLKKIYRDKLESNLNHPTNLLEKEKDHETVINKMRESISSIQKDISEKVENNEKSLQILKNTHDHEMNLLKQKLNEELKKLLDVVQNELRQFTEDKIRNIEDNVEKKLHNLEITHKNEVENFKLEKEKLLSEQYKKFHSFMEEYQKNNEKIWEDNSKTVIQNELKSLLTNTNEDQSNIFQQNLKRIIQDVVGSKAKEILPSSNENNFIRRQSVATQTEKVLNNTEKTEGILEKIDEISTTVKNLVKEMQNFKKIESNGRNFNDTMISKELPGYGLKQNYDELNVLKSRIYTPKKIEQNSTELDNFSDDIDKELEHYRKKYLSNTNWLSINK